MATTRLKSVGFERCRQTSVDLKPSREKSRFDSRRADGMSTDLVTGARRIDSTSDESDSDPPERDEPAPPVLPPSLIPPN